MDPALVQYLTGAGVAALVGTVWRLGTKVARQNGAVAQVIQDFSQHKLENREDFQRVFNRLDRGDGWWWQR